MIRRLKGLVVLLLAIGCFVQRTSVANAAVRPGQIDPMYQLTLQITASCSVSSGSASCYGYVRASNSTSDVSLTVTLYKQADESWYSVASWSANNQGQYGEIEESCRVDAGKYKAVVTGTVVDQNGRTETVSRTSPIAVTN